MAKSGTKMLGPLRTPQAQYVVGKHNLSPRIEGVTMKMGVSKATVIKSPLTGMAGKKK